MRISTPKFVRPCTTSYTKFQHICCTNNNITNCRKNLYKKMQAPKTLEHPLLVDLDRKNPSRIVSNATAKISERWMEYQGIKNWGGLLDPLDDNLRGEIIRYGHFVEAAYRSCDFDPSSSSYATCQYPKRKLFSGTGMSWTGYRVTKNLTATSGIQLPEWTERTPSWISMQSSWIGYVAVCDDKKEISRLGRRDIVIAFRGTATCLEWMENLRATLTPLSNADSDFDPDLDPDPRPMVESGFLSLYTSSYKNRPSLQNSLRQEIARILKKYGDHEPLSLTITGHSLGAALATLAAYDIKETFKNSPLVTVISFAGPRVGNRSFGSCLEGQGTKVLRIVNSDDLITKIPGFVVDNNNERTLFSESSRNYYTAPAKWVQKLVEDTQWVYADVGCELRLSSRDSPEMNGLDIATCHELKTYLHLVNGFVSSNCPFRANARKMINKNLIKT